MKLFLALWFIPFITMSQYSIPEFDVQGHRGARGLKPENTLAAFITALDSGVTTVELDLAVSKDNQLVVSHEPWMNAAICTKPDGASITRQEEMKFNLYQMDYAEIKKWDCGSKGNNDFPEQEKMSACKPLLKEIIPAIESHIKNCTRYEVDYNIEIKTDPRGDSIFHPTPEQFSDMVISLLDEYLPLERIVIQSFDFRVLKYLHQNYPHMRLSALVSNHKTIEENLEELGFTPQVYSPEFNLLSRQKVKSLHTKKTSSDPDIKVRVIPWTVNEEKDMLAMKGMGVDGLITDYPNRARKFKQTLRIKEKQ